MGRWCRTWHSGALIGSFTMKIFVFFGTRTQRHSLGAVSVGSCGCGHNTPPLKSLSRNRSLCSQKCTIIFLLRGTALSLIGVYSVLLAVILNISVLSVMVFIRRAVVIFVPKVDPSQSSLSLPSPCMPSPSPQHLSLPTPVQVDRLEFLLSGYNHSIAEFLSKGFREGFPLHYEGIRVSSDATNLLSARDNPEVVDAKLNKECEAGRLAGPFHKLPFYLFRVSPLSVVPKKTPGEFRLIHHLSYPRGSSVNDGISPEHCSVSYATISDAIQHIKATGPGCFLAKTDIKNAFRIIPIRSQDHGLLVIRWKGLYYYDRCMPMGCSSSCRTFETLSSALEWIAQKKLKIDHIIHLLDDFLIITPSQTLCHGQLQLFLDLCSYLSIPIAPEKTCGPATTLSFAGIELDSVSFEARLHLEKLQKCVVTISDFLTRKKVTLAEVQSLTGLLNFACSVVVPGRAFLRRLIDLTIGIRFPYHFIRLTKEVKLDLQLWQSFLTNFNGRTFFLEDTWSGSD